jgi:tryptophan synthase alpha chain
MSLIAETFARLRSRDELALMPYVMAGYPSLDGSLSAAMCLAQAGADLIEIGVPFSDPVADGVTIQSASQAALTAGFSLSRLMAALRQVRIGRPALLMSYLNPLLAYGRETLVRDASDAGICGLIVPDLPPEEADDWLEAARRYGIAMVFLVAPTSDDARIRYIAERSDGFLYAVSLAGTTGARPELDPQLPAYLHRIRRITDRPIAVGFGISEPRHIRALRGRADGAVVGSRLVQAIGAGEDLRTLMAGLKQATRR